MSSLHETAARAVRVSGLGLFERYLTLWVVVCIVAGIALGQIFPRAVQAIGTMEVSRVNLPVGLLIWLMIIPMLLRIDFRAWAKCVITCAASVSRFSSIGWSSRFRWRCLAGSSSGTCLHHTCRPNNSTATSRA